MVEIMTIFLGAMAGGVVSLMLGEWQSRRARKDRLADARLDLVRRLARYKNGPELASALNEVPVLFGGDPEAMRLYRLASPGIGVEADMTAVIHLVMRLTARVGLPDVTEKDIASGFRG